MALEAIEVKLSKLSKYAYLKRRHSSDQIQRCIHSIEKYGQYSPLVVSDDEVLCGQLVFDALRKLKYKTAFIIDLGTLSDEKKKEIRYIDNQTFDISGWKDDGLKDYIIGLDNDELFDSGFTAEEAERLVNGDDAVAVSSRKELIDSFKTKWFCPECGWTGTEDDTLREDKSIDGE